MLSRWQPRHLIGTTVAYWAALAVAALRDASAGVWRATHLPAGRGSVALSYDDGLLTLATIENGRPFWADSIAPGTLFLWVAGPPLLLVLAWLWARGRDRRRQGLRTASEPLARAEVPRREPALGGGDALGSLETDLLERRDRESAQSPAEPPGRAR